MKKKPPPLERHEEKVFMNLVKKNNLPVKIRKMNGLGFASWPDRLIIGPHKFTCWIEFKRKEIGKLSPGQVTLFNEMGGMGHVVHVLDDGKLAYDVLVQRMEQHLHAIYTA